MPRFSYEKTVHSDIESVFDIFSDYANYEKTVPEHFASVRVRSVRGAVAVVEEHVRFGPDEFVIMAKHVSQKPTLHEVFVIGGDIKGSHFRQQFVKDHESTKVIVNADIRPGRLRGILGAGRYGRYYEEILDCFVKASRSCF